MQLNEYKNNARGGGQISYDVHTLVWHALSKLAGCYLATCFSHTEDHVVALHGWKELTRCLEIRLSLDPSAQNFLVKRCLRATCRRTAGRFL